MVEILGEDSTYYSTVQNCVANIKTDRKSTEDGPRSGCPKSSTCGGQMEAIHRMIMHVRRLSSQIAETMGISSCCFN